MVRLIYSSILLNGTTTILLTVLHIVIAVAVNVGASLSLVDASPMTDVSVLCQQDYRLCLTTCFISVCARVCVCLHAYVDWPFSPAVYHVSFFAVMCAMCVIYPSIFSD